MTFFKRWNNIVGWAVFAIAALVYLMTMEPVSSLWDCKSNHLTAKSNQYYLPKAESCYF